MNKAACIILSQCPHFLTQRFKILSAKLEQVAILKLFGIGTNKCEHVNLHIKMSINFSISGEK